MEQGENLVEPSHPFLTPHIWHGVTCFFFCLYVCLFCLSVPKQREVVRLPLLLPSHLLSEHYQNISLYWFCNGGQISGGGGRIRTHKLLPEHVAPCLWNQGVTMGEGESKKKKKFFKKEEKDRKSKEPFRSLPYGSSKHSRESEDLCAPVPLLSFS